MRPTHQATLLDKPFCLLLRSPGFFPRDCRPGAKGHLLQEASPDVLAQGEASWVYWECLFRHQNASSGMKQALVNTSLISPGANAGRTQRQVSQGPAPKYRQPIGTKPATTVVGARKEAEESASADHGGFPRSSTCRTLPGRNWPAQGPQPAHYLHACSPRDRRGFHS